MKKAGKETQRDKPESKRQGQEEEEEETNDVMTSFDSRHRETKERKYKQTKFMEKIQLTFNQLRI